MTSNKRLRVYQETCRQEQNIIEDCITLHLKIPEVRYEDLRNMTGVDLILNRSWYIDYTDLVKYKEEYKELLTDTVYDLLNDLFIKKLIKFVELTKEE